MVKFFGKLISGVLIGLAIALLIRNGCTANPVTTSNTEASPSPVETATPDCLTSLSKVTVQKDEDKSSRDVEAEGDKFETQGKGQEALNKYNKARILYFKELSYATEKLKEGDQSAFMETNTSIESPEFPFKLGRAFAKTGKHEIAINCFTKSLKEKINPPNDASAYLNRGEAYLATGQKEKARQDYQKSVDLFQKHNLPQYKKMAADKLRSVTP
ncbi:tetratricopeptide repeat protein [Microcoleus sp. C2C3]|uniref:tetratricopeptide repeat protein n=1 Tax=unclassified Microcoleus TaxID=2642155 RepID=UPI002FD6E79D